MRFKSVILLFFAGALNLPALASGQALAEQGLYRPAKPYNTVPAASADICQNQCQGDAQCRSWNFVRLRSGQAVGICEFIDKAVAPIASPISISGVSASAAAQPRMSGSASARLVQAGTHTQRIGNPRAALTPAATRTVTRPTLPAQHIQTRQTARRPVQAQQARLQPARPQIARQNQARAPQMAALQNPALTSRPRAVQTARGVTEAPQPLFRPYLDGHVSVQPRQSQYQDQNLKPHQTPQQQPYLGQQRPQTAPSTPLAAIGGSSVPVLAPPPPNQARPMHAMPSQAPAKPVSANLASTSLAGGPLARMTGYNGEVRQKSLFGSLYDDVNGPVATPKVLGPQDIPSDLDAPIATVNAAPVIPVDVEPF